MTPRSSDSTMPPTPGLSLLDGGPTRLFGAEWQLPDVRAALERLGPGTRAAAYELALLDPTHEEPLRPPPAIPETLVQYIPAVGTTWHPGRAARCLGSADPARAYRLVGWLDADTGNISPPWPNEVY